jgi:hypothetical protein
LEKAIEFRGIDRAKKFQQIGIGYDLPSSDRAWWSGIDAADNPD